MEAPIGDFSVLPPEVIELVMSRMGPLHLVPLMLSCTMLNALAHNERIWDKVYKKCMPETHHALHLAPNPDYWKFQNASSIKFLYEYSTLLLKPSSLDLKDGCPLEVRAAMTVMKTHALSALVQRAAVYVIRRLAYYPQVCDRAYRERVEVYRSALGSEGAIQAAVSVLNVFDTPDVLSGSLCSLGNLVIDGDNAQKLCEVNGVEAIVKTMSRHSNSFPVLDYGCFALCNLGDDQRYKEVIAKAGAADVALAALMESKFQPEELTPPLDLLSVLCQVSDCKSLYGRRIIDAVDSLLPLAMSHSKLLAHTLTLAVLVCETIDDTRDYAVEKSFVDKMFEAMTKFHSESVILVKAALVLFTLFWRNDLPVVASYRQQLIRCIVTAMKEHKADVSLQRTSAAMLSDFAHSDTALKRLILDLGGKELVREALKKVPGDAEDNDPEWTALAAFISIDD
jgi:hypothetical protein